MTRDEWYAYIESAPLTGNQRCAIMRNFARLRFHPRYDRVERLTICTRLLGLEELDSVTSLTMADAGRLVLILAGVRDRGELLAVATAAGAVADDAQGDAGGEFATWPQAISRIITFALIAFGVQPMLDDGLLDHCGCCGHSRDSGCGGRDCPCRLIS